MYRNFNLTDEERKEILERHMSYGYKKPIKENKSFKTTIKEDESISPEPVIIGNGGIFGNFLFKAGKGEPISLDGYPVSSANIDALANSLKNYLVRSGTLDAIERAYKETTGIPKLPQFIEFHVGTSTEGSPEANDIAARERFNFLTKIVRLAFKKLNIDDKFNTSIIKNFGNETYEPKTLTRIFDPEKYPPNPDDRFGNIVVRQLGYKGLDKDQMLGVQSGLNWAKGDINTWVYDNVDEEEIVRQISKLASPSDIKELDEAISANTSYGSLESFLNNQLFDDSVQKNQIVRHLQKIAIDFKLPSDTVRLVNGSISIGDSFFR